MVQTHSQMVQQSREAQNFINLEEINRTSLQSPQQIPLHESNIEPLLWEVLFTSKNSSMQIKQCD